MLCKFKSLSLFISLKIDSFYSPWTQKNLHSMTKLSAGFATVYSCYQFIVNTSENHRNWLSKECKWTICYHWIPHSSFMIPDSCDMIPDSYYCIPDSYKWFHILTTKFRDPTNGLWIPTSGFWIPSRGFLLANDITLVYSHIQLRWISRQRTEWQKFY